jgi:arsenite-transporting ATPase
MIDEKFKKFRLLKMPLFPKEIRGEKDLLEYAEILFGKKEYQLNISKKALPKFSALPKGRMADFLKKDLNFIIWGGKGGVGKTVMAAATAVALAQKYKDKKILISTTDPAHALSYAFDQDIPLDSKAISLKGFDNLFALEIDAQKMLKKWKDEYRKDIVTVFEEFVGSGTEVVFDKKVLEELMELSPPGLEELTALGKIIDLMKEGKYDIYVLDSAASGHLLRFLELPEISRDWLRSIFKVLLKYKNIVGLVEIKKKLLDLSQDIKKIQKTLFGSEKTEFIMISIAEEMGIREMRDLAHFLEKLRVPFSQIVLNMIQPISPCRFCLAKAENQEKYITEVKKEYPKKEVVLVPLFPYDIKGVERLRELSKFLFG